MKILMYRLRSSVLLWICTVAFNIILMPLYYSTDFDVHWNWMNITLTESDITKWYEDERSEWTMDYPPFFMYFEYILSRIGKWSNVNILSTSSMKTFVIFHRITVLLSQIPLLLFVNYCVEKGKERKQEFNTISLVFGFLTNFLLILIDNIHFQYNGLLLALFAFALMSMNEGKHYLTCLLFSTLICFKHLFLYVSFPFAVGLLIELFIKPFQSKQFLKIFRNFFIYSFLTILPFIIAFFPFLQKFDTLKKRLFPVERGLTHSYWAGNLWSITNFVDLILSKLMHKSNKSTGGLVNIIHYNILPNIDSLTTIIISATLMILVAIRQIFLHFKNSENNFDNFLCSIILNGFISFLFGYHVHEKAILIILIPISISYYFNSNFIEGKLFYYFYVSASFSCLPLIYTKYDSVFITLLFIVFENILIFVLDQQKSIYSNAYRLMIYFIILYDRLFQHVITPNYNFDISALQYNHNCSLNEYWWHERKFCSTSQVSYENLSGKFPFISLIAYSLFSAFMFFVFFIILSYRYFIRE